MMQQPQAIKIRNFITSVTVNVNLLFILKLAKYTVCSTTNVLAFYQISLLID